MACKYYVNGKWITEVEFKAHLLGGALENAINSGVEIEGYPKMEAKVSVSKDTKAGSVVEGDVKQQELDAQKVNKEAGVDIYVAMQGVETNGEKYTLSQINENGNTNTFVIEDVNGNEVGKAQLSADGNYLENIRIDEKHRRKGLASKVYDFIELRKGIELQPSPNKQSKEAKALWDNRNLKKTKQSLKEEAKDSVSDEDYPESVLSDEEELSEEERVQKERDMFGEYIQQEAPQEFTEDELDQITSSYYMDDEGVVRDYDGDETTIEAVVEKAKELKQGTIGESEDGKIRFVKEGDRIIMRDANGNEILPQTRSSEVVTIKNYDRLLKDWENSGRKKGAPEIGKKYFSKREADENVRLVDLKTYKKYEAQLQKLNAVKGEPINSQDPREIADKSNDPRQIKDAYEDEKARLREIESTTSGVGGSKKDIIYELIKGGISEGDARIIDLDNRDGSISTVGWKIYDTGKGDIDTVIDAFNDEFNADITLKDIKDFIDEYNGGPHQYKAEREQTLRDLETKYKELTGFGINTKEATKVESKTKAEPKVETKVEPETKVSVSKEEPITAEKVKQEVKEEKIVEPTEEKKVEKISEAFNKTAENLRKIKNKPRKLIITDENGNDIEVDITTNDFWNAMIEIAAVAIEKTGKVADGIKAAIDYLKEQDFYKKLTPSQQAQVETQIKDEIKTASGKKFKKKERKFSKTIRKTDLKEKEEVKKLVDADPYTYSQISNSESIEEAKAFIDKYGIEEAESLATSKGSDISLEEARIANVLGMMLMEYYGIQASKTTDITEKNKLLNKVGKISEATAERMTLGGQLTQVALLWTKTTPEAALRMVQKAQKRANESKSGKRKRKKFDKSVVGYNSDVEAAAKGVIKSERVKKIKGEKVLSETNKEIDEAKRRQLKAIDEWTKKYLATDEGGFVAATFIPPGVVKGAVKVMISAVKAGVEITAAIKKAIAYIKAQMGNVELNEAILEEQLMKRYEQMKEFVQSEVKKPVEDIEKEVKDAIKERNAKIDEIILSHFTKRNETKQELIDRIVNEAGVSKEAAAELAKAVEEEFNKITKGGARKIVEKWFGRIEKRGKITEADKQAKRDKNSTINRLNEALNLNGLIDKDLLLEYFGAKFGIKSLTEAQIESILKYSEAVQKSEGKFRAVATQKLINEISRSFGSTPMDIFWALYYPSMLSGLSTSTLNILNNASNVASKYVENPLNPSLWLASLKLAFKNKSAKSFIYGNPLAETIMKPVYYFGRKQFKRNAAYTLNEISDILKNGLLDDKFTDKQFASGQRIETSPLEDKRIREIPIAKYAELYKYVGRFLLAQDAMFFRTNEESEFISSIRRHYVDEGLTGKDLYEAVLNEVIGLDKGVAIAKMEKEAEEYEKITDEKLTKAQKNIRTIEILRENRNKEAAEEAKQSAETMVYRGDFRGGIGWVAYTLSTFTQSKNPMGNALRLFVPFTKIVSNVFNYMVDYTPIYGLLRANGLGLTGFTQMIMKGDGLEFKGKEILPTQMGKVGEKAYYDQMGRAWLGLTAFSSLAALVFSQLELDDDDPNKVFIVGNHAGLNREQSKNAEITDPKGTIRIGKNGTPIPYKNIPALDIPLTIIGNFMDLHRWSEGKGANEKLAMAMFASKNTFMEKSFVKGINDFNNILFDDRLNGVSDKATQLFKTAVGYATKPLPQNTTLVTQIDDIFSKYEWKAEDVSDILMYAAYNGSDVGKPRLDVFGMPYKTYPGETFLPLQSWLFKKQNDPVWSKLADEGLTKKISKFGDLSLYDIDGNPLPVTKEQDYIYKAYAGREWYKMLNKYLNDEKAAADYLLVDHNYEGDFEKIGRKEIESIIQYTKDDAAKIAYYRIASDNGLKYNIKDLDWLNSLKEVDVLDTESDVSFEGEPLTIYPK